MGGYNGLCWEALPEWSTFVRRQIYERVGFSLVGLYKRVGVSVVSVCKQDQ